MAEGMQLRGPESIVRATSGAVAVGYLHHGKVAVVAVKTVGDYRRGEQRAAELFGKAAGNVVVGYSDAHLLAPFERFGERGGAAE